MPVVNLRSILFPRRNKSASSDIYKQLSDTFRLREQMAEVEGWGKIRTPEALNDIIEKNKNELFNNLDNLDANQVRDLGSVIENLNIQKLGMIAEEAVAVDDIEGALKKSKSLFKKKYTSNPYEYANEMKKLYDVVLYGDDSFEGLVGGKEKKGRIEILAGNDLNVSKLEQLKDECVRERKKYDEIITAFNQKKQNKLDTFALVYEMSGGRVRTMEFVRAPEKKGVITNKRYNYESEKSKLSDEQGVPIRLIDTQVNKLPEEREIAFGFSPFRYAEKISSWRESIPAQYMFQGDIDTFDYSELEPEGIETRSVGDLLQGSNEKMYYVDKNKDLRPIRDEGTYRMLLQKGKSVKDLSPDEEEKLSYLVKEPFDISEAVRQNRELSGIASQISSGILQKMTGPVSPPSVPSAGFRPTEFEYQKKALLQQTGKVKVLQRAKEIFGGVWGAFK